MKTLRSEHGRLEVTGSEIHLTLIGSTLARSALIAEILQYPPHPPAPRPRARTVVQPAFAQNLLPPIEVPLYPVCLVVLPETRKDLCGPGFPIVSNVARVSERKP
jgi:hypothetical protein